MAKKKRCEKGEPKNKRRRKGRTADRTASRALPYMKRLRHFSYDLSFFFLSLTTRT